MPSEEILESTEQPDGKTWNDGLPEPEGFPEEFVGSMDEFPNLEIPEGGEVVGTVRARMPRIEYEYFEQQAAREVDRVNMQISQIMREKYASSGLRRAEFAKRLGVTYNAVSAALAPKAWRVSTMVRMFAVLGFKVDITLRKA